MMIAKPDKGVPLDARIYVAGHRGLVGSAITAALGASGYRHIITATRQQLDLRNPAAVRAFYSAQKPEYVYVAAAKVGGILANATYPADFLYDNLSIQLNLIDGAYEFGVKKLLFLGSTCIYPKFAPQPLKEEYLLTGPLEPTNESYAIAKIAGIKMCQAYRRQHRCNFICAMPTNLYGPGDTFDLQSSHVIPALIRKFHEAKTNQSREVVVWGTGNPRREFLYVHDLAGALLHLMNHYNGEPIINVGVGKDISIRELADLIQQVTGYGGAVAYDSSRPDGTPRKLLDVTRLERTGWKASTTLATGLTATYRWFVNPHAGYRSATDAAN